MARLTPSQVIEARAMRNDGLSWNYIAKALSTKYETVRRRLDPEFAGKYSEIKKLRREAQKAELPILRASQYRPTEEEFQAARRLIPKDTRDLTGRLFGDPLPGRSALDQRGVRT